MDNKNISSEAFLSNDGDMTSFRYGNSNIRFRTPKRLKRFTEVKEWDNGYIVVMADYEGIGETEEYIDLLPIAKLVPHYFPKRRFHYLTNHSH